MKSNVINPSHQIQIQGSGRLAIIGKNNQGVVFMASGLSLYGGENIEGFAKNSIFTSSADGSGDMIIFEYHLSGELRNPQKLLKSVRNKLMQAINAAQSVFENEMNQLDHEMSMSIHHPGRYSQYTSDAERRGYELPHDFLKLDEQGKDPGSLVDD